MEFAKRGAKKYARNTFGKFSFEDFESAAYTGLVVAARKFDPSRGLQFTTMAFHWIDQHLKRVIQLERRQSGWSWGPLKAQRAGGAKGMQRVVTVESWPSHTSEDGEGQPLDLPAENVAADRLVLIQQRREIVLGAARTEREREMLEAHLDGQNMSEIGRRLDITGERVRQLLGPLLSRVQEHVQAQEIA